MASKAADAVALRKWPLDRSARSKYERCVVASASSSEYQERSREEFEHRGALGAHELRITNGDMATTYGHLCKSLRLVVGPGRSPAWHSSRLSTMRTIRSDSVRTISVISDHQEQSNYLYIV